MLVPALKVALLRRGLTGTPRAADERTGQKRPFEHTHTGELSNPRGPE